MFYEQKNSNAYVYIKKSFEIKRPITAIKFANKILTTIFPEQATVVKS